ncbi:MAG: hypothetical protein HYV00_03395 [Deltaproteobacteria bacterium]|nr:hypothetical protein [Deltaproteobacteria bacterium]
MKKVKTKRKQQDAVRGGSSLGTFSRKVPALARAQRVAEKASDFGFDWAGPEPVWGKIEEELSELKSAVASGDKSRVKEEMGDLLFSLVNLSRFLELEAEESLSQSTDRFLKRFSHVETKIRERGKTLSEASLEEMDLLWEEAKRMAGKI